MFIAPVPCSRTGSSPLTRGKPTRTGWWGLCRGLIPAHAGKTHWATLYVIQGWAHPRSRGENARTTHREHDGGGSSPLTRGKLSGSLLGGFAVGLIPAHAGKTISGLPAVWSETAHPRSRGENARSATRSACPAGSSPLTRGKHDDQAATLHAERLIPAHAGKTAHVPRPAFRRGAHPRSRGENAPGIASANWFQGSSPLTRGKLDDGSVTVLHRRLIPAHAGKT